MKCHYDVLNVPRDANLSEIRKAYKLSAIKWHPDKNLDNVEAATEQFQLIQQAFEVLSDPHERAWYDDHRDSILKGKVGGDRSDGELDVYQYFTASCYKGYGDDEKGFFYVYREVFNKISAEDSQYYSGSNSDVEVPSFGKSNSSPEDVQAFYAYWQSYCTKKSYSWLDPFDSRTADNRRVSRIIEKENKKVRDRAKKARNEEVRELVKFVRKRDKRVKVHALLLLKQSEEKARIREVERREKIKKRNKELESQTETEWSKFSNLESQLKDIEASLASEFGDNLSDSSLEERIDDHLYCIACNKLFKTPKAFENHENSKRHKDNVLVLKQQMLEGSGTEHETEDEDAVEDGEVLYEHNDTVSHSSEDDKLYCDACGKQFQTLAAIETHNKTQKHIDNYKQYKDDMHDMFGETYSEIPDCRPTFEFYSGSDEEDKMLSDDEMNRRLCNKIDEFTKDNDVIKAKVDKVCQEFDEFLDVNGSEGSDESILSEILNRELLRSQPTDEKVFHSLPNNRNALCSDDDNDDFMMCGSRKKQKKKQKSRLKSSVNKQKRNENCTEEQDTEMKTSQFKSSANRPTRNENCIKEQDTDPASSTEKELETSSVSQESLSEFLQASLSRPSTTCAKETVVNKTSIKNKKQLIDDSGFIDKTCAVCTETFSSKNKLFIHLSKTGHSINIKNKDELLRKLRDESAACDNRKKSKNKKNKRNN